MGTKKKLKDPSKLTACKRNEWFRIRNGTVRNRKK